MNVADAEETLRTMLVEARIDPEHLQLVPAWRVFRSFADQPVASESDGVLVQSGTYNWEDGERFVFDFLRQVQLPDDDEFVQIHCEFEFEPTPALRALGTFEEWWFRDDDGPLEAFLDDMESSAEFRAAKALTPTRARLYADET